MKQSLFLQFFLQFLYYLDDLGVFWCLWKGTKVVWIWTKWLTYSLTVRGYQFSLGRNVFVILLCLPLGSRFESMWGLSCQESEADAIPVHLLGATLPRSITSSALFGMIAMATAAVLVWQSRGWALAHPEEGQGSEFQLTGFHGFHMGLCVSAHSSISKTRLGKDTWIHSLSLSLSLI
jgi:hypothetical protein